MVLVDMGTRQVWVSWALPAASSVPSGSVGIPGLVLAHPLPWGCWGAGPVPQHWPCLKAAVGKAEGAGSALGRWDSVLAVSDSDLL